MMKDSTQRFTDRVADYVQYRPDYPPELIQTLVQETGLAPDKQIADIGSGTGILTRLLLETGCRVYAVEPNAAMRQAAENLLNDRPGFLSVNATAENTGLPDHCLDGITVAQAFHWFDRLATKQEFRRVLHSNGFIALIWNNWRAEQSSLLSDYAQLLESWGTDYQRVRRTNLDDAGIGQFFHPIPFRKFTYANQQVFDYEGLQGRLLSSSYTPQAGHPKHLPMLENLQQLFARHQVNGMVTFDYETVLYLG
jgi:SAM-dependent methyltransferase